MGVKVREWKGAWWLFVDHQGRRKARRVGVGKDGKKSADLAAIRIQARLAEGGDLSVLDPAAAPLVPTFKAYSERWLTAVAGISCKDSTVAQYRHRIETRLSPHLGALPLTAITRDRVKALIAHEFKSGKLRKSRQGLAPRTVRAFINTLVAILNSALEDGLIPSNPAARLGKVIRRDQTQVEEIEVFTPDELTTLLEAAARDWPDHHMFLLCLARSGIRLGEALALRWEDIDWRSRVILIRRTTRRGSTSVTKNGKARRVDMSQQLGAALEGWQTLQEAEAAVAGCEASAWIFSALRAARHAESNIRRVWRRLLSSVQLRYRKLHTLRHTFASLLIQAGEPVTYVQVQLGHHSAAFTLTVYGHFVPRAHHRGVDRLDDVTVRNPAATNRTPAEISHQ
jgi:integrase